MSAVTRVVVPRLARAVRQAASHPPTYSGGWLHLSRSMVHGSLLLAADAAVLLLLAVLIHGVRDERWLGAGPARSLEALLPSATLPPVQLVTAVLLCLAISYLFTLSGRLCTVRRSLAAGGLGVALPYWDLFWSGMPGGGVSAPALTGFFALAAGIAVALAFDHLLVERVLRRLAPIRLRAARVLLLARPEDQGRARQHPALGDEDRFVVAGVFDPGVLARSSGGRKALCQAIGRAAADTLVLGCGPLNDESFGAVLDAADSMGCEVMALTRSRATAGTEPRLVWSHGAPLVVLTRPALRTGRLVLKRAFDLVGALLGLVAALPLMLLIALAIRLESRGPIIFAQLRMGSGGQPFRCLKFRSMRVDAEAVLRRDPVLYATYVRNNYKLPEGQDPRITAVGRFLRKTSLDELPQLWNVLRGDMSLVGPRPVVPEELTQYGEGAILLLSLKPGIAGAWAVNGRSQVGYPARADMELAYVRNWNIGLDLSILARGVRAVLSQRGAH